MGRLKDAFEVDKPIIDMVHLRSLPGSPRYDPVNMGVDRIISIVLEKAAILEQAGVNGVQVENMWDTPYLRNENIGYETAAVLAVGVHAVRDKVSIPVGAEYHMDGADCAMAYAIATGANWIRVFEWCSAFVPQSGFINAMSANVSRMRSRLKADQILALCDVNVKHESHYIIHDRDVTEQATDIESQDGDAVIVTGFNTGIPPSVKDISKYKKSTSLPIPIGSNLNNSNINELLTAADGTTIGSWLKKGSNQKNSVNYDGTKEFMNKVIALRRG